MRLVSALLLATVGMMPAPSPAGATAFQEGRNRNCPRSDVCRLTFAGPGPGRVLHLQHVTCRLRQTKYGEAYPKSIDLFDGNNALFMRAAHERTAGGIYEFALSEAINNFLTGGPNITITADLDYVVVSQLACTISGDVP